MRFKNLAEEEVSTGALHDTIGQMAETLSRTRIPPSRESIASLGSAFNEFTKIAQTMEKIGTGHTLLGASDARYRTFYDAYTRTKNQMVEVIHEISTRSGVSPAELQIWLKNNAGQKLTDFSKLNTGLRSATARAR